MGVPIRHERGLAVEVWQFVYTTSTGRLFLLVIDASCIPLLLQTRRRRALATRRVCVSAGVRERDRLTTCIWLVPSARQKKWLGVGRLCICAGFHIALGVLLAHRSCRHAHSLRHSYGARCSKGLHRIDTAVTPRRRRRGGPKKLRRHF